jgi:4-carboxymuconolactone decarboxylase
MFSVSSHEHDGVEVDSAQLSEDKYRELFGDVDASVAEHDPALALIMRRLIFGDVFHIGDLDDRTRELITIVVLTILQTLPQLRAHTVAALNAGVPSADQESCPPVRPIHRLRENVERRRRNQEVYSTQGISLLLAPGARSASMAAMTGSGCPIPHLPPRAHHTLRVDVV